jgi:hypothetical protein
VTLYDALMFTGRLPAQQVRELCLAATELALAELELEEAEDAANLGNRIWLAAREVRAAADMIDGNDTVRDVDLRYDVALAGANLLDRLRDAAAGRVAAAQARVNLLKIRFGIATSGPISSSPKGRLQ